MAKCPSCGAANIEGVDVCDRCGMSLADLHLPVPATEMERALLRDRVKVLQPKKPIVAPPEMPVGKAICLLAELNIGCVVIVENERPIGIFSERDALLKLNANFAEQAGRPVSQFMTPNPQTLQADVKLAFAVQRMDTGSFRHLPIVDADGKLTGIISVRDILRYLSAKSPS